MEDAGHLYAAITVLAGAVAILYEWARTNFMACKAREEACTKRYTHLLEFLAGVRKDLPATPTAQGQGPAGGRD